MEVSPEPLLVFVSLIHQEIVRILLLEIAKAGIADVQHAGTGARSPFLDAARAKEVMFTP